jgi:molecular chaperone IbpA
MLHHTLAPFTSLTPQDLQKRLGFSVGFDNLFDSFLNMDITRDTGYPPYNIRKLNEYQYAIEMALAGFSKEDIEVEAEDGKLTVRSKSETGEERGEISDNNENFVHRGIAKRSFLRQFNLSDDIIVKSADLKDGMLIVSLERVVPDEKKPKLIPIG